LLYVIGTNKSRSIKRILSNIKHWMFYKKTT
jgi:hypothetical protein